MRATDINSSAGLQYTLLPDRGLDISLATFKGINLVYQTSNGETHPVYNEPEGFGWLHTIAGGLLTTCGLTHLSPPYIDDGEQLDLHGRYSTIPFKKLVDLSAWEGEEYHYKLRCIVEDRILFGKKLWMEREISSVRGQDTIRITDKVTNFGNVASPYTILYHMNFGYPLLSKDIEFIIDPLESIPHDADAVQGINEFRNLIKPQPAYRQQVFIHTMRGDQKGKTSVTLKNIKVGTAITIKFNMNLLPYITQWKIIGYGEYVLGIEPSNVQCKSRKIIREEKALFMLHPGEITTNIIEISVDDICANTSEA